LLEARQRPALDGDGENEPAQQVTEVVGDHPKEQPYLVGPEAVTGEARPMGGFLAFLDPLPGRPALVVEAHDRSVPSRERGDDEAHPGEQLAEMMFDLGDHAARTVPRGRLILAAPLADQRGVAGPPPVVVSKSSMRRPRTSLAGGRSAYRTCRRSSAS